MHSHDAGALPWYQDTYIYGLILFMCIAHVGNYNMVVSVLLASLLACSICGAAGSPPGGCYREIKGARYGVHSLLELVVSGFGGLLSL